MRINTPVRIFLLVIGNPLALLLALETTAPISSRSPDNSPCPPCREVPQ